MDINGVKNVNRVVGAPRRTIGLIGMPDDTCMAGEKFDTSDPDAIYRLGQMSTPDMFYYQGIMAGSKKFYYGSDALNWKEFDSLEDAIDFSGYEDDYPDEDPKPKKKKGKKNDD